LPATWRQREKPTSFDEENLDIDILKVGPHGEFNDRFVP